MKTTLIALTIALGVTAFNANAQSEIAPPEPRPPRVSQEDEDFRPERRMERRFEGDRRERRGEDFAPQRPRRGEGAMRRQGPGPGMREGRGFRGGDGPGHFEFCPTCKRPMPPGFADRRGSDEQDFRGGRGPRGGREEFGPRPPRRHMGPPMGEPGDERPRSRGDRN